MLIHKLNRKILEYTWKISKHISLCASHNVFFGRKTHPINPIEDYLSTLTSFCTVERYPSALEECTFWYTSTTGAGVDCNLLTAVEVKEYTDYLQTLRRLSPDRVNLRLAAIRSFCAIWDISTTPLCRKTWDTDDRVFVIFLENSFEV